MARLIILGLDGFHKDLLKYCPFLKSIYYSHPHSILKSTIPPHTAAAWATILTGKDPGQHGVVNFVRYGEDFKMRLLEGHLEDTTLFEYLSRNRKTFFSLFVPFSYPPAKGGNYLFSWLSKGEDKVHPSSLLKKHKSLTRLSDLKIKLDKSPKNTLEQSIPLLKRKKRVFFDVLDGGYEVIFAFITETDRMQHMALQELGNDTEKDRISQRLLKRVDDFVKELVTSLSPEDDLILLSDHGFAVYEKQFRINNWLEKNGYLRWGGKNTINLGDESSEEKMLRGIISNKKRRLNLGFVSDFVRRHENLKNLLYPIAKLLRRKLSIDVASFNINLDTSDAYCLSGTEKGLYINRRKIKSSSNIEAKRKELIKELNSISGITAYPKEKVYKRGRSFDSLPDIILDSEEYDLIRGSGGNVFIEHSFPKHHRDGFFCAIGKSFSEKSEFRETPCLQDIAPTVLHLLELPVPEDMDGRVLSEIFKPGNEAAERKIRYTKEFSDRQESSPSDEGMAEEDEKRIKEQLKALGYLD